MLLVKHLLIRVRLRKRRARNYLEVWAEVFILILPKRMIVLLRLKICRKLNIIPLMILLIKILLIPAKLIWPIANLVKQKIKNSR